MIYLFHGLDTYRSLKKVNELVDFFKDKKNASLSIFNLTEENFDPSYFENLIKSSHLFGDKNLVVLKRVLENKDANGFISGKIEECGKSDNIFIFFEETVVKEVLKIFEKSAKKILKFDPLNESRLKNWFSEEARKNNLEFDRKSSERFLSEYGNNLWALSAAVSKISLCGGSLENVGEDAIPKPEISIFSILDAFSERDNKKAWFLFQRFLLNGFEAEEVFWKIIWQLKNLLMVKLSLEEYRKDKKANITASAAEFALRQKLKIHPFVIKKCVKAEKLFSLAEIESLNEELSAIYKNSRYGNLGLSSALEKFLLGI